MNESETRDVGRRRCHIPEHRKQIKSLQRQLRFYEEAWLHALALTREARKERDTEICRAREMMRWRRGWVCRLFGHWRWFIMHTSDGHHCGRCGRRVPSRE